MITTHSLENKISGTLYICATPIGNLSDISIRTLEILKQADAIAAEDTRHTLKLLNRYGIKTPLISYHEHNRVKRGKEIALMLKQGNNIALVSDAGTPGISDPGEELVKSCIENQINITASPGPAAFVCALILSGLSCRRFVFEGFLPQDKKQRTAVLNSLPAETRTVVFYESPHHLKSTLKQLYDAAGNRNTAVVRELTKKFEEIRRGKLKDLISFYEGTIPKGEYVIVLEGADQYKLKKEKERQWKNISIEEHVKQYIEKGLSEKESLKQVSKDRGVSKRIIYAAVKKNNDEQ